jgi:urease alpha subunit
MTFDLEKARACAAFVDPKEAFLEALAEIERLRAELASANVELMAAGEIVMAAKQLRAEGKIGPDVMPRVWQITEERKEAFGRILRRLEYDQSLPGHTNYKIQRAMELLRAMLEGAGQ